MGAARCGCCRPPPIKFKGIVRGKHLDEAVDLCAAILNGSAGLKGSFESSRPSGAAGTLVSAKLSSRGSGIRSASSPCATRNVEDEWWAAGEGGAQGGRGKWQGLRTRLR